MTHPSTLCKYFMFSLLIVFIWWFVLIFSFLLIGLSFESYMPAPWASSEKNNRKISLPK